MHLVPTTSTWENASSANQQQTFRDDYKSVVDTVPTDARGGVSPTSHTCYDKTWQQAKLIYRGAAAVLESAETGDASPRISATFEEEQAG